MSYREWLSLSVGAVLILALCAGYKAHSFSRGATKTVTAKNVVPTNAMVFLPSDLDAPAPDGGIERWWWQEREAVLSNTPRLRDLLKEGNTVAIIRYSAEEDWVIIGWRKQ